VNHFKIYDPEYSRKRIDPIDFIEDVENVSWMIKTLIGDQVPENMIMQGMDDIEPVDALFGLIPTKIKGWCTTVEGTESCTIHLEGKVGSINQYIIVKTVETNKFVRIPVGNIRIQEKGSEADVGNGSINTLPIKIYHFRSASSILTNDNERRVSFVFQTIKAFSKVLSFIIRYNPKEQLRDVFFAQCTIPRISDLGKRLTKLRCYIWSAFNRLSKQYYMHILHPKKYNLITTLYALKNVVIYNNGDDNQIVFDCYAEKKSTKYISIVLYEITRNDIVVIEKHIRAYGIVPTYSKKKFIEKTESALTKALHTFDTRNDKQKQIKSEVAKTDLFGDGVGSAKIVQILGNGIPDQKRINSLLTWEMSAECKVKKNGQWLQCKILTTTPTGLTKLVRFERFKIVVQRKTYSFRKKNVKIHNKGDTVYDIEYGNYLTLPLHISEKNAKNLISDGSGRMLLRFKDTHSLSRAFKELYAPPFIVEEHETPVDHLTMIDVGSGTIAKTSSPEDRKSIGMPTTDILLWINHIIIEEKKPYVHVINSDTGKVYRTITDISAVSIFTGKYQYFRRGSVYTWEDYFRLKIVGRSPFGRKDEYVLRFGSTSYTKHDLVIIESTFEDSIVEWVEDEEWMQTDPVSSSIEPYMHKKRKMEIRERIMSMINDTIESTESDLCDPQHQVCSIVATTIKKEYQMPGSKSEGFIDRIVQKVWRRNSTEIMTLLGGFFAKIGTLTIDWDVAKKVSTTDDTFKEAFNFINKRGTRKLENFAKTFREFLNTKTSKKMSNPESNPHLCKIRLTTTNYLKWLKSQRLSDEDKPIIVEEFKEKLTELDKFVRFFMIMEYLNGIDITN
jgi:hypothetical protein